MCGIAGILLKHDEDTLSMGKALIDMLDGCQHRGPDSTGFALYGAEQADRLRLRFFVGEDEVPTRTRTASTLAQNLLS